MNLDVQKASILKRIAAFLLDFILLLTIIVALGSVISGLIGLDDNNEAMEDYYDKYEQIYGIDFEITEEEYYALSEEDRANYDAAYDALVADDDFMYTYGMVVSQTLLIVSLSILAGYLLTEFAVPLLLGNGQTIGKKVFSLAVMRTNCVKINTVSLFIRTVLGKYTIETMIPVLVVIMLLFGTTGLMGTILVLGLAVIQVVLLLANRNHAVIHDLLSDSMVVDMSSQMIFESEDALLDYKKRMSAEKAAQDPYF